MKRAIIILVLAVSVTGCGVEDRSNVASTGYATDRCGGINRGWHRIDDYSGDGEVFVRNVLFLKKSGLITWNGVARKSSDLDAI